MKGPGWPNTFYVYYTAVCQDLAGRRERERKYGDAGVGTEQRGLWMTNDNDIGDIEGAYDTEGSLVLQDENNKTTCGNIV